MKILHLTSHLGGGVGTVILNWIRADKKNEHKVIAFEESKTPRDHAGLDVTFSFAIGPIFLEIGEADITVLHMWEHDKVKEFLEYASFPGKVIGWVHQKYELSDIEKDYPDVLVGTSLVIPDCDHYIWSTGGISKYLKVKPKKHEGFNIGYIGTIDFKKMHPDFFKMVSAINIPDLHIHVVGHSNISMTFPEARKLYRKMTIHGWLDDIRPILKILDVFFYPLRPDHYGTCEQVLGETMAAGVIPIVLDNPCERLIVHHNVSGLIARNPGMAVNAVQWLHNSDDRYLKELSDGARDRAKEIYSMRKMVKDWNRLFKQIKEGK